MAYYKVAIDGPSGAGKSTIAKELAVKLGIDYIDTGAMYRAIGYKMLKENIDGTNNAQLSQLLSETEIDFKGGSIYLDGDIIDSYIRTPEISKMASNCSAIGIVREKLVDLQRKMGNSKSVIMDGRDIGTNVFPDADYKFFITASSEERARRRYNEMIEKGQSVSYERILEDIKNRDHNDSTRELNPLKKAADAVEIDTTEMSINEVVNYIYREIKKNGNS
ncbi:MAG: (d)CMP kinase [Eubacteriales bacterium]|nr:(d)CMP kinase [Eubacteriales bacterium]